MAAADSVASLYEATRGWGLIDHNLVAGDTQGAIGHRVRVRARVPRRSRAHGWLPMPGWTGEYEWQSWIAHEDMPCVIDPPDGLIVTANNRVVADDHPDYLCTDCHPPYRARRIRERACRRPCGALSRYVFDVGNWEASRWVVFHGVSGQPGAPHYADQNVPWSACRMVPMRYDWAGIAAAARDTLHLDP